MAMMQHDFGKWSGEYLYSTDGALIGARGLYNFGRDPRKHPNPPPRTSDEKAIGRFSMGAEFYYGILNKSAGSNPPPFHSPPDPLTLSDKEIPPPQCPQASAIPPSQRTLTHQQP